MPVRWTVPTEMVATCHPLIGPPYGEHQSPSAFCDCGLYAYHSIARAKSQCLATWVVGAVIGFGTVFVHDDGFRCERARLVALGYRSESEFDRLAELVRALKISLIAVDALEKYGREFGAVVAKSDLI